MKDTIIQRLNLIKQNINEITKSELEVAQHLFCTFDYIDTAGYMYLVMDELEEGNTEDATRIIEAMIKDIQGGML